MDTTDVDVLVVGAGPTGLTAALLLARDGIPVRVVDRNGGPVTESRALVVQARTAELWHKLGLAGTVLAEGRQVRGAHFLIDGRELTPGRLTLDLAEHGDGLTPYPEVLVFGQDQTERMLLDALAAHDVPVDRSTVLTGVQQDTDQVTATLTGPDGTDRTYRARYLVGADGAHSTVRRSIGARFDGQPHEGTFFLADTAVDWARDYGDALTVALDSGGGIELFVPMHDPGGAPDRFRIFGSLDLDPPGGHRLDLADVQRRLDHAGGVPARLHDPRWVGLYRLSSRMADTFGRGRVFLAGDAAHIHTPTGGQGMNTGIQDAINLAWKLSAVLRGQAHALLLDTYDAERRPVAHTLLATTDSAFAALRANGPTTRLLRPVLGRLLPRAARIPRVGRRIFTTISQLAVGYPASPAVSGTPAPRAGPGDRAPHALLATGTVFDLLTGTDHHLLLFPAPGDPSALRDAARTVTGRFAMPIRTHLIDPSETAARDTYRAQRPCLVLVRPDGHIGWRGSPDDLDALDEHLSRWHPPTTADAPPVPSGRYRVDPASTLTVTTAHWFGTGTVRATIPLVEGEFTIAAEAARSYATATADPAGFHSGRPRRDRTVVSARLLDAAAHPRITWTSAGLHRNRTGWRMPGVLTVRGTSHPLDLRADSLEATDGVLTLRCAADLDRRTVGVTGLPGVVGHQVHLDLELRAELRQPVEEEFNAGGQV